MKKVIGIIILGLLWCNVGFSEQVGILCKSNVHNGEDLLTIDLEEKKMVMIGTEFKIIGVSEAYITGHGILFNSTGYNVRIILNRYNGELSVNFFETESMTSKDYLHSYKTLCKKAKKLI